MVLMSSMLVILPMWYRSVVLALARALDSSTCSCWVTRMAPSMRVLYLAVHVLAGDRWWNAKWVFIPSGWRTVCWWAHVAVRIAAVRG